MEIKLIDTEKLVGFGELKVGDFCYFGNNRTFLYMKVPYTSNCSVITVNDGSLGLIRDYDMVLHVEVKSITVGAK